VKHFELTINLHFVEEDIECLSIHEPWVRLCTFRMYLPVPYRSVVPTAADLHRYWEIQTRGEAPNIAPDLTMGFVLRQRTEVFHAAGGQDQGLH
jgi:hypothetical protein